MVIDFIREERMVAMRKILKKFGVGMLVMSLALTLPPNYSINTKTASANGKVDTDDPNNSSHGKPVSGTATVTGYGFRVSLRDIRAAGEGASKAEKAHSGALWKVKSGIPKKGTAKYIMKSGKDNSADRLEWDAKTNGLYLGLSAKNVNYIYSEASGRHRVNMYQLMMTALCQIKVLAVRMVFQGLQVAVLRSPITAVQD